MTKSEIISFLKAKQSVTGAVLHAAEHLTNDEAADQRLAVLSRRLGRINKLGFGDDLRVVVAGSLVLGAILVWFFGATEALDYLVIGGCGGMVAMVGVSTFCGVVMTVARVLAGNEEANALAKIAGTDRCEEVLSALKSSTDARQWRDIALAERAELRVFDANIIAALNVAEYDESERQKAAARRDDACKQIHGISPGAPA